MCGSAVGPKTWFFSLKFQTLNPQRPSTLYLNSEAPALYMPTHSPGKETWRNLSKEMASRLYQVAAEIQQNSSGCKVLTKVRRVESKGSAMSVEGGVVRLTPMLMFFQNVLGRHKRMTLLERVTTMAHIANKVRGCRK